MTSFFRDKIFYGWVIVFAGLIISIMGIGSRYCFGVFLKSLEADFGVSRASSSAIFSLYMLLSAFIAILGGWILDRYGPKKLLLLMATFSGLSFILTSQTGASWQLFITYSLILSLGTGPTYGLANSTTARWFVKKRGLVIAITSSGGGLGAIIFAPVAAYLVSEFGWRTAFVIFGLILWIVMTTLAPVMKKDPSDMGLLPDGMKASQPLHPSHQPDSRGHLSDFSLSQACRMHQFWLIAFNWVFLSLGLHMVFVHIVPYAMDAGLSSMDAAFIISLIGAANIPGRLLVGQLSDLFGRKALAVVATLIHFLSLIWLLWASGRWELYVFGIAFGFLWGGGAAVITAYVGDIFGTRSLGAILGVISGCWAFGAAAGPALGGILYDVSGHYLTAFALGAFSLLLAALVIIPIKKVGRPAVKT